MPRKGGQRKVNRIQHRARSASSLFIILLCHLLLACALYDVAEAQSGRRVPKRTTTAPGPPSPVEAEPSPPPSTVKPTTPKQVLIIGLDYLSQSIIISRFASDTVLDGFLERIGATSSVSTTVDKDMNNKTAKERAKKETENHVVLLRLETDCYNSDSDTMGRADFDCLVVVYNVFEPQTAKSKAHGRVYVRSARTTVRGRVPPIFNGSEQQLREAGRETAERVMSSLHIGRPVMR
jgi:hypothetical protein